jgi:hypothetical protein
MYREFIHCAWIGDCEIDDVVALRFQGFFDDAHPSLDRWMGHDDGIPFNQSQTERSSGDIVDLFCSPGHLNALWIQKPWFCL